MTSMKRMMNQSKKFGLILTNGCHGRSYIPTPKGIEAKEAVVNVQNKDNQCFKWAVLSALHPLAKHANRVFHYKKFENELDFTGISFPVMLDDI